MSATTPPPAIAVKNLRVLACDGEILAPISFEIPPGGTLTIMGETGAGKSLLAQAILGDLPEGLRAEGEVRLHGIRQDLKPPAERAALWGREIVMLPQEPWRALDPLMRAEAQIEETHHFVALRPRAQAKAAARRDMAALGLEGAGEKLPGQLSGGMAQRVAFAAARAGGAPVLIADEPTKGLDADRRDVIADLLAQTPAQGGALLTITHDAAVARRLGGHAMILRRGALVEEGPAQALLDAPQHAYTRSFSAAEPASWPPAASAIRDVVALEARNLSVARGGKLLLGGFDLTLKRGEKLAITGPSGCGKSSLLDVLAGLVAPASGTVTRGGGLGRLSVQKLYQDPPAAFPPGLRLGAAMQDLARLHRLEPEAIPALLDRLGVSRALLSRRPGEVSGGELQRIALARVLALRPAVLLADEPTSRLDPITQRRVMELIAEIAAEAGIAVLLVTHDPMIAARWADRSISLGSPREALRDSA